MAQTRSIPVDEEVARYARLLTLVRRDFGGDNEEVVAALREATGQKVTLRSVQTWLVAQGKVSHRRAPDWVINGLETFLKTPGNAQALEDRLGRAKARRMGAPNADWAEQVLANHAVEMATQEMEHEVRDRQRLREAGGVAMGDLLFDRFRTLEKEVAWATSGLSAILRAIDESTSIEDLKTKVGDLTQVQRHVGMYVRQARAAIEKGDAEFSNADGLPVAKAGEQR